jgi:hypothetical protein
VNPCANLSVPIQQDLMLSSPAFLKAALGIGTSALEKSWELAFQAVPLG